MEFGVALGVASLTIQVLQGCVKGYEFILAVRGVPAQYRYLITCLRLEETRLRIWCEAVGIDEHGDIPNSSLNANRWLLHEIFAQIKDAFETFNEVQKKYMELVPESSVSPNGPSIETLQIEAQGLEHAGSGESALRRAGSKAWALISQKAVSKNVGKRFRWVVFRAGEFTKLLEQLTTFNDKLHSLLDHQAQENLLQVTKATNMVALQVNNKVDDLLNLVQALTMYQTRSAQNLSATSDTVRAEVEILDQNRAELIELARFKAFQTSIEAGDMSESLAERLKLGASANQAIDPRIDTDLVEILHESSEGNILGVQRSEAIFKAPQQTPQQVWIEWRECHILPESANINSVILTRLRNLASLLHADKPPQFRVPYCLGYIDMHRFHHSDEEEDEESFPRVGYVFAKPGHVSPATKPISLHRLLASRHSPSLTSRILLAKTIAKSILYLHSTNWLHKGLSSHSVVFFDHNEEPSYSEPILCGFGYARPAKRADLTESPPENPALDIYRHPHAQRGGVREAYKKSFDYYSLGIILIEIGFWKSIDQILSIDLLTARPNTILLVRDRILNDDMGIADSIQARVGNVYASVISTCLDATRAFCIDEKVDETRGDIAALLQREYEIKVVKELESVRI